MPNKPLSSLTAARYGKTKVRVFRIVRQDKWHHIVEYNVDVLLEGDIESSYTEADNSVVVATDSIKNITYYLAKVSPHILNPEKFALHLGTFFVSKYAHVHKAFVAIEQLRWARIPVEAGKEHPHAFYRDGDDKRVVKVEVDASKGKDKLVGRVGAGISDLLVLKSTGSKFEGFIRDEYTTLVEVDDRIFSTSVDLEYTFSEIPLKAPGDAEKLQFAVPEGVEDGSVWDEEVPERARRATLEVFAEDESASVQATLYKMAQRIIAENAHIQTVTYTLPNKHYIPVDMKYIGVDNLTPLSVLPFLLSLFSCVLRITVLFLLIVMDDFEYARCARRYRASTSFSVNADLLMTTLCRRIFRSDFLSRPFLFIVKLFPLLATFVDACMLLFLLCCFPCSISFLLTFSVPAESSLA